MNLLRRLATAAPAALFLATLAVPNSLAVTIDWVTVGDPGNAGNAIVSGTPGAVSYEYRIMKYEWTNSQYVQFLNAVDPQGTNPNGIYSNAMATNAWGGIAKTGTADGSRYVTLTNFNDKPVTFVSWWSAARVANWLQAGGLTYATSASGSAAINDGVYTLNGGVSGTVPAKNPGTSYWIPTGDEWYKAAFYKGSGTNSGYWVYSPQSNVNPTKVNATAVGTGSSGGVSPVTAGNFANYDNGASWNGRPPSVGNLTRRSVQMEDPVPMEPLT